ncbi:uncharacterized protein [Solanum tuberosum]|uniref:uncharacterized protein n=1 Tax=Solanum tuberosum TaxID=4113 RepID=UPI0003D27207|nr:PREDICTED: uncharacterized protein LOC102596718 [Solanum tuberosum]
MLRWFGKHSKEFQVLWRQATLLYLKNLQFSMGYLLMSLKSFLCEHLHGVHFVISQHSSNFTFWNWQRERYMLMGVKLSGEANQDMLEWFGKHFKFYLKHLSHKTELDCAHGV